ncbi:MAG: hypothetical protein H6658_05280 [Ardenticatenaceae bacterium]|nr:hypothetical protein [Ardenticatenaceae bacterium]
MLLHCPECGAPLPVDGTCRDNFHALLGLESQVPGGAGEVAHFYAVSCYALQHPLSFNYKEETLHALRQNMGEVLNGRLTLPQLLNRTRRLTNNATPITRRPSDPTPNWYSGPWPMNVSDVCAAGVEGYATAVHQWAKSVCETLSS